MECARISRHIARCRTRHPRHLSNRRLDVGRDRRSGIDCHDTCGRRALHQCHRYRSRLRTRPFGEIVGKELAEGNLRTACPSLPPLPRSAPASPEQPSSMRSASRGLMAAMSEWGTARGQSGRPLHLCSRKRKAARVPCAMTHRMRRSKLAFKAPRS